MSVRDNINSGVYSSKRPYPARVVEPAVLRKTARDLSPSEAASLQSVKAAYEAEKADMLKARHAYQNDEASLIDQFWNDVFAEYGISEKHPLADWLREKSWEQGHASGLSEVLSYFDEYSEVIDIINQHFVPKK